MEEIDTFVQFKHPANILICGPSHVGKTVFVKQIVQHVNRLFHPEIKEIIWCCATRPPWWAEFAHKVTFVTEIPDPDSLDPSVPRLLIFDDWMGSSTEINRLISKYFTKFGHHTNSSVIHIVQSVFNNADKYHRIVSVNAHYLVIFRNLRDQNQIRILGSQLFPKNQGFFDSVLRDVTRNNPYGYLLVDLKPDTSPLIRLRTDIFPTSRTIAYLPPVALR